MGHSDRLLRYMTHLLLMTFVACHPFPSCHLGCHSSPSLSSRAEMPPKNNLKKNKRNEKKQQLRITHDKSVKCFRNASHHTPPHPPVLWRQSIHLCEQLEAAVIWSVVCSIVQISRAHIWYPGGGSGVKAWHINWAECMQVTKMTLRECAESH